MLVVNHVVKGYESTPLENLDKSHQGDIVVVIDRKSKYDRAEVYKKVKELLAVNAKLHVVFVGDLVDEYKAIAALMASYENYHMYTVESAELVFKPYVDSIVNRTPTKDEVANLLDGEIIAISEVNNVLLSLESLVREGNIGAMEKFIQENMNTIDKMSSALDYMRSVMDKANTLELEKAVEKLNKEVGEATKAIKEAEAKAAEERKKKEDAEKKRVESEKEVERLTKVNKSLQAQTSSASGSTKISMYTSVNTSLIQCKVKSIVYFKEISYVRYVNSMVMNFKTYVEALKSGGKNLRVKLLIYDDGTNFANAYAPINVITGEEYNARSAQLIGKLDKFVVREPNRAIIEDILTYNVDPYDVVIIYDRMKQAEDVVIGNNVHKFYVLNGSKDLENMRGPLKLQDSNNFIVPWGSSVKGLQIDQIPDYSNQTETAKRARYFKLKANEKDGLFSKIGEIGRINALAR